MFQDKDIICFLGDSITANGLWMAEVYQELRKKYRVKCYNCGVSGATAAGALEYLHSHCLIYNPDYVVMMFGINDIDRVFYGAAYAETPEGEKRRKEAMELHKMAYEKLVQETISSGAKAILCLAVPYDEVSERETENLHCPCGMNESAAFLRRLATAYNCPVVDFGSVMQPMLAKREIIREDRVHPTPEGYHVMAQIFLKDTGEQGACDFDTPFVWEPWNEERYHAEQRLHKINFVEFCALLREGYVKQKTLEERKQMAKERYEACEDKTTFIPLAYKEYAEIADIRAQLTGELVKRTIF